MYYRNVNVTAEKKINDKKENKRTYFMRPCPI